MQRYKKLFVEQTGDIHGKIKEKSRRMGIAFNVVGGGIEQIVESGKLIWCQKG